VDVIAEGVEEENRTLRNKRLNMLLNKARIQDSTCDTCSTTGDDIKYWSHCIQVLPALLQDITDQADKWGNDDRAGRIDPFTEVFDVSLFHRMSFFFFLRLMPSSSSSAGLRHDRPGYCLLRPGKEQI